MPTTHGRRRERQPDRSRDIEGRVLGESRRHVPGLLRQAASGQAERRSPFRDIARCRRSYRRLFCRQRGWSTHSTSSSPYGDSLKASRTSATRPHFAPSSRRSGTGVPDLLGCLDCRAVNGPRNTMATWPVMNFYQAIAVPNRIETQLVPLPPHAFFLRFAPLAAGFLTAAFFLAAFGAAFFLVLLAADAFLRSARLEGPASARSFSKFRA